MTADTIIQMLGGDTRVAKALSAPVSTVNSWRRANTIPRWRHSELLSLAMVKGVSLSTADFPQRERKAAA